MIDYGDEDEKMDIYSEDFLNRFIEGIEDAIADGGVDTELFLKMLPADWEERIYDNSSVICTNVKNYNINFEDIDQGEFELAFEGIDNIIYEAGFTNLELVQVGRQGGWLGFNLGDLIENGLLIPANKDQIKEWIKENHLKVEYYTESDYMYYGDPMDVGRDLILNCDNIEDIMSLVVINPDLIDLLDSLREKIDSYFEIWEKDYGI